MHTNAQSCQTDAPLTDTAPMIKNIPRMFHFVTVHEVMEYIREDQYGSCILVQICMLDIGSPAQNKGVEGSSETEECRSRPQLDWRISLFLQEQPRNVYRSLQYFKSVQDCCD